jgi:hypothetical protein
LHLRRGSNRAALGCPSLGRDDVPIRVPNTCLQPLTNQGEQGPGGETPAPPVQQPRLVPRLAAALDLSLSQRAIPSVLAGTGAGTDRLPRPPSGARAVPTIQTILRRDGCQPLRTGQWHPCVCQGGHASGPGRGLAAWTSVGPVWPGSALFAPVAPMLRCGPARWRPRRRPSRGPPLAASVCRACQPSCRRAASQHRSSSRNRGRWSAVAVWARPRREGGGWGSAPPVSGRRGLGGRRPAVPSCPLEWACPTAASAACYDAPKASSGRSL